MKAHLRDLDKQGYDKIIKDLDLPSFRSQQLFQWIQQKGVTKWEMMSNLPLELKNKLSNIYRIDSLPILRQERSKEDKTVKYLFRLDDGETIETVLMNYGDRRTVCISTQVGCALGCEFCATGKSGFKRNLHTYEIIEQVLSFNRKLLEKNKPLVTNLVFMGMGEPLKNYDPLVQAIRIFSHSDGLNISPRRISVSTSGIVPKIYRLADEGLPLVLAISLHAGNDKLRSQLMPINQRYPLADLLKACQYWIDKTGRRITFEYVLLAGVNDDLKDAEELANLLGNLLANVNLIPFNPVAQAGFQKPTKKRISAFQKHLESKGITVTTREEKGGDIAAACGQLRRREMRKNSD